MKLRIINICAAVVLAVMPISLFAQDPAMYVYRTDGTVNGFLMSQVDSLSYSNIGRDSVEYDIPVVQQIWTKDGLYEVPISEVDSIGYYTPEPVFKSGIFIIDENNVGQVVDVDLNTLTISFLSTTPDGELPKKGQVIFSELEEAPFPMGFSGRVTEVRNEGGKRSFKCVVAGPDEVYDRLLLVGHVGPKGHQNNMPRKNSPKKGHWDGSFNINTNLFDELLIITGKGALVLDYTIDINAFNSEPICVWCKIKKEIDLGFEVKIKGEEDLKGGVPSNWATGETVKEIWGEPIHLFSLARLLNLDLRLGGYFSYGNKFSIEASGLKWKYVDIEQYNRRGHEEPDREELYHEAGWNFDPMEDNIFDVLKLKAELQGSVSFGLCAELDLDIWDPDWLALALAMRAGPELKGSFAVDTDLLKSDSPETMLYKFFSEDLKMTFGCKLGLDLKARAGDKEYKIAKASTTLFPKTVTLLPKLSQPALPKIYEVSPNKYMIDTYDGWDSDYGFSSNDPMAVGTIAKNQPLFPGTVGLSIYGETGSQLKEYYSDSGDWTWNWQYIFSKSIRDISPQTIKVYPVYKILGAIPVKADPSTITIPEPLSLSTHTTETKVGDAVRVTLTGGWGYYSWECSDDKVASLKVVEDNGVKYLEAEGVRPGNTTIKVTDVRSGDSDIFDLKVKPSAFTLSTYELRMNPKDVRTVTIFPYGEYQLKNSKSSVASVKILPNNRDDKNSSVIQVTALKVGTATITVSDAQNAHSLDFEVVVTNDLIKPGYLSIEPTIVDFGNVPAGNSRTETFTISNTGEKNLKFVIKNTCEEFYVSDSHELTTLEPGKSMTFDAEFFPEEAGKDYECGVVIQTDASNGSQVLKLKGHGVEPSRAHINVTPSVLDFGEVEVNTAKTMQFTVSNTGETRTYFSISEPASSVFNIPRRDEDIYLSANREKTFDVTFMPEQVGKEYECEVIVSSDAENGNQTFILKGKGKEYEDYVHGVCSGFTPEDGSVVDASNGFVHVDAHEFILPYSGANIVQIQLSDSPLFPMGKSKGVRITWNGQKGNAIVGYNCYDFEVEPNKKYYWHVSYYDYDKSEFVNCSPILTFTTKP